MPGLTFVIRRPAAAMINPCPDAPRTDSASRGRQNYRQPQPFNASRTPRHSKPSQCLLSTDTSVCCQRRHIRRTREMFSNSIAPQE